MIATIVVAAAAAAQAPTEKPARAYQDGRLFCLGPNRTLSQTADGAYELTAHMEMPGNLAGASWPGEKPLIGPNDTFKPGITTGYKIPIGKNGSPSGRPRPFAITATMGRFTGGRPEPIESLRLKIEMASPLTFPEMPLEAVSYSVAVPIGKITLPETKDRETEVVLDRAAFEPFVRTLENGERTLVLLQNGSVVGRIPVPYVPLRAQSEELLAWTASTAQAMTARKACPVT